jgi:hypothetical protein
MSMARISADIYGTVSIYIYELYGHPTDETAVLCYPYKTWLPFWKVALAVSVAKKRQFEEFFVLSKDSKELLSYILLFGLRTL